MKKANRPVTGKPCRNRKLAAAFFFLFPGVFSLFAQESKDVVLVVDTSASMSSYYNEVGTYLTGPFLAENVTLNDTLHIISFGSKPRFEIARRILEQGDIETVSGRIWLLYPLEPASDSAGALSYAEQYVKSSIPGGRPKKVFLISDDNLENLVQASVPRFRAGGAELVFIKAAGRIAAVGNGRENPGAGNRGGTPRENPAALPRGTGGETRTPETGGTPAAPPETGVPNPAAENVPPAGGPAPETDSPGTGTPPAGGPVITGGGETGNGSNNGVSVTDNPVSPPLYNGSSGNAGITALPLPLLIAGLALLVILALVIFMKARSLHASPNKVMASAGSADRTAASNAELLNSFATKQAEAALQGPQRRYHYRDDSNQFLTNPAMLNLFVEEQNTAIGRRNVHTLKKGNSYTVGGGNSDFLIFLVSVPPSIGQIYFDGSNCTFTPLKPKYFPDIGSAPVRECIGKTIRVLSDKNYELFFRFERFKDPLLVLNQLLHSIALPEAPGAPPPR
ncbi:MAG: VWA domain-containing protein [Treponema sp.]|nr:VWA domain-containing protein [Treponema sp.]